MESRWDPLWLRLGTLGDEHVDRRSLTVYRHGAQSAGTHLLTSVSCPSRKMIRRHTMGCKSFPGPLDLIESGRWASWKDEADLTPLQCIVLEDLYLGSSSRDFCLDILSYRDCIFEVVVVRFIEKFHLTKRICRPEIYISMLYGRHCILLQDVEGR